MVVKEIVSTEQSYSKGLEWLVLWKNELKTNKIITDKDIEDLFSTAIDFIKQISDVFLIDISNRAKEWHKHSEVGDIFQSIAPYFKQYIDY